MNKCLHKHTRTQVPDDHWVCPKCGAKPPDFHVYDCENMECDLLHPGDHLVCLKCDYGVSGKAFAAAYARKANLVPCPHCKGKGMVKKVNG